MTPEQFDAICARDDAFPDVEAGWDTAALQDRRALIAYVKELREELAAAERGHDAAHEACVKYDAELSALKAAAGKVTCYECSGAGTWIGPDCPDCAELRELLK